MALFSSKKKTEKSSAPAAKKEEKKSPTSSAVPVFHGKAARASGVLVSPHITEKSTRLAEMQTYSFKVYPETQKSDIRKAVEGLYGVHVTGISVVNVRGKKVSVGRHRGKSPSWRKAMVTIKKDETIAF